MLLLKGSHLGWRFFLQHLECVVCRSLVREGLRCRNPHPRWAFQGLIRVLGSGCAGVRVPHVYGELGVVAYNMSWWLCSVVLGLVGGHRGGYAAGLDSSRALDAGVEGHGAGHALARQKYWQIRTTFTALSLYIHLVRLYPNDY